MMRPHHGASQRAAPARGAALLVAMVLLTVVATLASGMVWQQWKGVEVESAERSRVQSAWVLRGALDWARLILREDARSGRATSLSEPWATPLAETRLSTFLAVDGEAKSDAGPEAFLDGSIIDAQSHYNLRNLVQDGKLVPAQLAMLDRLCANAGIGKGSASQLAEGWLAASLGSDAAAPLPPQQLADLVWLGLDAATIERLASVVVLLPVATPINLNTAPREVLAGVISGLDLGGADRLLQARQRQPFRSLAEASEVLGKGVTLEPKDVDIKSAFFEVQGRLRLDQRRLSESTLIERRNGLAVVPIQRLRPTWVSPATR
jgi:general secretion pathway protein K